MNKFLICIFTSMMLMSSIEACVTYNPSDGTYTVDKSGHVER